MTDTKYAVRWTVSENGMIFNFEEIYEYRGDAQHHINELMNLMEGGQDDSLIYCGMIDIDD